MVYGNVWSKQNRTSAHCYLLDCYNKIVLRRWQRKSFLSPLSFFWKQLNGLPKAVHMLFTETSVHCFCSNVSSTQKCSHQSLWIQMPVTTFLARWYKSCRSDLRSTQCTLCNPIGRKGPSRHEEKHSHSVWLGQTHCRQAFRATLVLPLPLELETWEFLVNSSSA